MKVDGYTQGHVVILLSEMAKNLVLIIDCFMDELMDLLIVSTKDSMTV